MSFGGMWDQLVGAICRPPRCNCPDVVPYMNPLCPLVSKYWCLNYTPWYVTKWGKCFVMHTVTVFIYNVLSRNHTRS